MNTIDDFKRDVKKGMSDERLIQKYGEDLFYENIVYITMIRVRLK